MRFPIATNKIFRRVAKWAVVGIGVFIFDILQDHLFYRFHTSVAKQLRIGLLHSGFNLSRKERFNKGARAIIHRNCLLPVLSDGWIEMPCYLFRMFWRMSLYCGDDWCAHGEKGLIGGDRR